MFLILICLTIVKASNWKMLHNISIPFLNSTNFHNITNRPSIVVTFVAPWCSISKSFLNDIASNPLEASGGTKLDPPFPLAIVDAVQQTELYDTYKIETFPTAFLFQWGVVSHEFRATSSADWTATKVGTFYNASIKEKWNEVTILSDVDGFIDTMSVAGIWGRRPEGEGAEGEGEGEEEQIITIEDENNKAFVASLKNDLKIAIAARTEHGKKGSNEKSMQYKRYNALDGKVNRLQEQLKEMEMEMEMERQLHKQSKDLDRNELKDLKDWSKEPITPLVIGWFPPIHPGIEDPFQLHPRKDFISTPFLSAANSIQLKVSLKKTFL